MPWRPPYSPDKSTRSAEPPPAAGWEIFRVLKIFNQRAQSHEVLSEHEITRPRKSREVYLFVARIEVSYRIFSRTPTSGVSNRPEKSDEFIEISSR